MFIFVQELFMNDSAGKEIFSDLVQKFVSTCVYICYEWEKFLTVIVILPKLIFIVGVKWMKEDKR